MQTQQVQNSESIAFATESLGKTYEELGPIMHTLKKNLLSSNDTSDEFMVKHSEMIDWVIACRSLILSPEVIRQVCGLKEFDWKVAVQTQTIPNDVLEENMHKMDWGDVQKNQELSVDFIRDHKDAINIELVLKSRKYPQEVLNLIVSDCTPNNLPNLLRLIVTYQTIDEQFMLQHWEFLNRDILAAKQTLSPEFITSHIADFNVNTLAMYQKLPEAIIISQFDKIQPSILIKMPLPGTILMEHFSKFNTTDIAKYQNITPGVLEQLKKSMSVEQCAIILRNRVINHTAHKLPPLVNIAVREQCIESMNWEEISMLKLSVDFIRAHVNQLNMFNIASNSDLSIEDVTLIKMNTIERYVWWTKQSSDIVKKTCDTYEYWWTHNSSEADVMTLSQTDHNIFVGLFQKHSNLVQIVKNHTLPEWFLELMVSKLDWYWVCRIQKLSNTIITKYINLIDPTYLVEYQMLSEDFIIANKDILMWDLVSKHQIITERMVNDCSDYIDIAALETNKVMKNVPEIILMIRSRNPTPPQSQI